MGTSIESFVLYIITSICSASLSVCKVAAFAMRRAQMKSVCPSLDMFQFAAVLEEPKDPCLFVRGVKSKPSSWLHLRGLHRL